MTSATDRMALIRQSFQRGDLLTVSQSPYRDCLSSLLQWLLASDGVEGDQTVGTLTLDGKASGVVQAKQPGVAAGIEEAVFLIRQHTALSVEAQCPDGHRVEKGETLLSLTGSVREVISFERLVLNIVGRMSGIATQTRELIALTELAPVRPLIAVTRKAPWTLLDKKAAYCGGGLTHRLSLSDGILIKDNHLAALKRQSGFKTVEEAIQLAVNKVLATAVDTFEIEVESPAQAEAALTAFERGIGSASHQPTMVVMLDNFEPQGVSALIQNVQSRAIYQRVLFEASGDITAATLPAWIPSGVDVVSLGALTHSVKALNVSMAVS